MKKSVSLILISLMLVSMFSVFVLSDDDNESDDSDLEVSVSARAGSNYDDSEDKNEIEYESETESEIEDGRIETKTKEKIEVRYANGTRARYEYELRERRPLDETERERIIRVENRLRIHTEIESGERECPSECSCTESVIRCEFIDENQTRRELTIRAGQSGNTIIQTKNVNASTQVTLYKSEDGRVIGVFRDNETREIILPDEARERIEARMRLKLQNDSLNLTLDEEGEYNLEARKRARLFFVVPVRERIHAEIDAETGEIISTGSSWWGFLARDIRTEYEIEAESE